METLDCTGLACPQPVIRTKQLIETKPGLDAFIVEVDNEASAQNVARFAKNQGFTTTVGSEGSVLRVQADRSDNGLEGPVGVREGAVAESLEKTLVLITADRMGSGDDTLGRKLMTNYINTLEEMGEALWRIIFLNSGVKLTVQGAETLASLDKLVSQGIRILVCGTCLTHFDLLEQKKVGETTNMLDVVTSMQLADKVISV